jgi:hypothetical protein
MKKSFAMLFVALSVTLVASAEEKNNEKSSQIKVDNKQLSSADPDEVILDFTRGDQTDIYAIPLDEDQLDQQEELDNFIKESKNSNKKAKESYR